MPPSPPPSDPISESVPEIKENNEEEPILPKGAYSMDFDQFDDPNFNPFASKKAMQNSPPSTPAPQTESNAVETPVQISEVNFLFSIFFNYNSLIQN